mmetsp:Transcript_71997/g.171984  ORF Transcript_71997/g.171984 Transcript_71997/m.171984 type:complete len:219 (-) Transcript_71997:261-917(-)
MAAPLTCQQRWAGYPHAEAQRIHCFVSITSTPTVNEPPSTSSRQSLGSSTRQAPSPAQAVTGCSRTLPTVKISVKGSVEVRSPANFSCKAPKRGWRSALFLHFFAFFAWKSCSHFSPGEKSRRRPSARPDKGGDTSADPQLTRSFASGLAIVHVAVTPSSGLLEMLKLGFSISMVKPGFSVSSSLGSKPGGGHGARPGGVMGGDSGGDSEPGEGSGDM